MTITRTPVDPVIWSAPLGFHQGVLVTGQQRTLHVSGQTATDAEGGPQHGGDLRAQMALSLDNLAAVLDAAGMSGADVVRLTVFTTDVDALLAEYEVLGRWLADTGASPAMTLVQVVRLAVPGLLVEIEATAVD